MLNSSFELKLQKNLKELFKYYFAHFLILLIAFSYFLQKRVQKYETFPNILNWNKVSSSLLMYPTALSLSAGFSSFTFYLCMCWHFSFSFPPTNLGQNASFAPLDVTPKCQQVDEAWRLDWKG